MGERGFEFPQSYNGIMQFKTLKKLIATIHSPNILVVGDLILDQYIWGRVDRISPEAPIQVFSVESEDMRLGGAGNTIRNLVSLGARVSCLGLTGNDSYGKILRDFLAELSVDLTGLFTDEDRPTTIKSRLLAKNQQVLRIDREKVHKIGPSLEGKMKEFLEKPLGDLDLILISDYGKGLLTDSFLQKIIQKARETHLPLLVDPKGRNYLRYRGATAVTPNQYEAQEATAIVYEDEHSLERMALWLMDKLELEAAVITLGSQGVYLQLKDGYKKLFPARARSVYDVTGAGDTVIASLAVMIASGVSFQEAVPFANCAAALVVEKLGVVSVTPEEMLERAQRDSPLVKKVLSLEKASQMVKIARQEGKKVVFTNGCFDLLHTGHLQYLDYARSLGDILIIGLNSDESIREIKGKNRPFLPLDIRLSVLTALEMVDGIVVFETSTPIDMIETLRPDILVKGEDYRDKIVVGREVVEAYGGKVEFAPLVGGYSSTSLAKKISQSFAEEKDEEKWSWEIEGNPSFGKNQQDSGS